MVRVNFPEGESMKKRIRMDNHGKSKFHVDPSSKIEKMIKQIKSLQKTQHKNVKFNGNGAGLTLEIKKMQQMVKEMETYEALLLVKNGVSKC